MAITPHDRFNMLKAILLQRVGVGLLMIMTASATGCRRAEMTDIVPTGASQVALLRLPTTGGSGGSGGAGDTGSGWGTLKGVFKFTGAAPSLGVQAGFDPNKDALCKVPVKDETLVVDPGSKGIHNVLLYLRVAPRTHPEIENAPPKEAIFDQRECRFLSHVFASSIKDKFVILNTDEPAHNSKGAPGSGNPEFNELISPKTGKYVYPGFKKPITTPYDITCSIHPWMKAYHIARPDTYFAVTAVDGTFTIDKLPAGVELEFQVWHERGAGEKGGLVAAADGAKWAKNGRMKVTIPKDGDTVTLNVNVDPSAFQ